MLFGFNIAQSSLVNAKKLTQLECASDRKDSQMLLGNIREPKREGMKHLLHHVGRYFIDMEHIRRNKRVLES